MKYTLVLMIACVGYAQEVHQAARESYYESKLKPELKTFSTKTTHEQTVDSYLAGQRLCAMYQLMADDPELNAAERKDAATKYRALKDLLDHSRKMLR